MYHVDLQAKDDQGTAPLTIEHFSYLTLPVDSSGGQQLKVHENSLDI
jgi:hypothetical protein